MAFYIEWGRRLLPVSTTVGIKGRQPLTFKPKGRFVGISAAGEHAVALRGPGPELSVGPDFREMTTRQPSLERVGVSAADRELSDALQVVQQGVIAWRRAGGGSPAEAARRDEQVGQFERPLTPVASTAASEAGPSRIPSRLGSSA